MVPVEVLKLLGIGWGVYELYPNPTNQPAFASAIDRLFPLQDEVMIFEIGAGTITCEGEVVELTRGGAERLALRLFVHEVEWLQIVGQPKPAELAEFFRLLAADEAEMHATGGLEAALRDKQVASISVTQRGVLVESLDNVWEEAEAPEGATPGVSAEKVAHMVQAGATADSVAEAIMMDAGDDSGTIAEVFCDAYRRIYPTGDEPGAPEDESVPHLLAAAYGAGPRRKPPVDTFAEAFFLLPVDARAQVLTDFLVNRGHGLHGLLLDQFAGLELAELAPQLDEAGFAELEAYVRDVVDTDLGTADELMPLVSSARQVQGARQSTAERIRNMIEGIGDLGGSSGGLAAQLRDELALGEEKGVYVFSTLLEVEERSNRLNRILEAWCERLGGLIRDGDFEKAAVQLAGGRLGATTQHKTEFLENKLSDFAHSESQLLVDTFLLEDRRDPLIELLSGFGEPTAAKLMQQLAIEESSVARRALIGILAGVAANYPAPMDRFFAADEWYVVRNAVTIATKVGGQHWVGRIQPLTSHSDHRVVVESLRALAAMAPELGSPELVRHLNHPHERVAETAALLLHASTAANLEQTLTAALFDRTMESNARSEIADVLFNLGSPTARAALEQIARKQLLLTSHRRDARRAARAVLASAA